MPSHPTTDPSDESRVWDRYSADYERQVFSLTSFQERRQQIVERITPGLVLNAGCGPTDYLNKDLISAGARVIASDFSQEMIRQSEEKYFDPQLEYRVADSRALPFSTGTFNTVVSVNSILPKTRDDVQLMFNEFHRVLVPGGSFVGFLVSFDSAVRMERELSAGVTLDHSAMRIWDTGSWQCFHTKETILEEMGSSGFAGIGIDTVELSLKGEVDELARLYGIDTSVVPVYEYLVTASKLL